MAGVPAYLVIYDVMAFASVFIFSLMIITAVYSKSVHRRRGWFGMMACWLLYSISYCLLVGKQSESEPGYCHCFAQTVLIYAAPPLVAVGTLSFNLDLYFEAFWDTSLPRSIRDGVAYSMLVLPWLIHLGIDIQVIILTLTSSSNPAVERIETGLYCHLSNTTTPSLVNAAIVILAMALLIPLEVLTGIQLYRRRSRWGVEDFRRYLSAFLRLAACTIVAAAAFGLSAISIAHANSDSIAQNLSFPFLSLAVSLIFSTQQDLMNAWFGRPAKYLFSDPSRGIRSSMDQPLVSERRDLRVSESSGYNQGISYD